MPENGKRPVLLRVGGVLYGSDPQAVGRAGRFLLEGGAMSRPERLALLRRGSWWLTRQWLCARAPLEPRPGEFLELWQEPGEAFANWWQGRNQETPSLLPADRLRLVSDIAALVEDSPWVDDAFEHVEGLARELEAGWTSRFHLDLATDRIAVGLAPDWSGSLVDLLSAASHLAGKHPGGECIGEAGEDHGTRLAMT